MFIRTVFTVLILLLASGLSVNAQSRTPETREDAIRESLININSADPTIASQAAQYFGIYRATEGVPSMLKVLQQKGFMARTQHNVSTTPGGVSEWTFVSVREAIVAALAAIKDQRAVPVLKKYLRKQRPADTGPSFNQNVAWALFQITGRLYKYRDAQGSVKVFRPSEPGT